MFQRLKEINCRLTIFDLQIREDYFMGITIYYKGNLNNADKRKETVDTIKYIGETAEWEVNIIDERKKNLYGAVLQVHEECDPLPFLFDSTGRLRSLFWLAGYASDDDLWTFTKTQFAGFEAHIIIIKFLDFIKKNFISDLEVKDDTDYWTHRNSLILQKNFRQTDFLISSFGKMLSSEKFDFSAENTEILVKKIENAFEELFNRIKKKIR